MNITYNNLGVNEATDLVTFTDIPNILKVEDTSGGTRAQMTLNFVNNLSSVVTGNSQFYITIIGETITNVTSPESSVNKHFYISDNNSVTAPYVARALRCCPSIAANFTVEVNGSTVIIRARDVARFSWDNMFLTNIATGSTNYLVVNTTGGTSNSSLSGGKIQVGLSCEDGYITTLEKNFYGGECAFDLSPVITSIAEVGKTKEYNISVTSLNAGSASTLATIGTNYVSMGYMCNQGYKYLDIEDKLMEAQNFKRGAERDGVDNNTILYLYGTTVPFSFYADSVWGRFNIYVTYRDSDGSSFGTYPTSGYQFTNTDSSSKLKDYTINLCSDSVSTQLFNNSYYIDISLSTQVTWRYNVIKPLKATEYYQRILWRNSYGGISFFDFTGQKTITNDISTTTYQNSIYGYYTDEINTLEKVYDVDVKTTYTLKSHLIEADGRWVFYDIMESPLIWTEVNGELYEIMIENVSVEETNNNNVFEATIKFHFSQPITLL